MKYIYHYTTIDSLLGMINNTSETNPFINLWASHFSCLNDPQEKIYGEKVLMRVINEIEKELNVENEKTLANHNKDIISLMFDYINKYKHPVFSRKRNKYIISFSQEKDSLPMWSMYGKNGNGICLEIDMELLISKIGKQPDVKFEHVWYGEENVYLNINDIIKAYKVYLETDKKLVSDKENYISLTSDNFKMNFIYRIKHEAYAYENEIRLIIDEKDHVKYRTNNGYLIPYIDYQIPIDCITSIIIGPSIDQERIIEPLRQMLWQKGIDLINTDIEFSTIPYRM